MDKYIHGVEMSIKLLSNAEYDPSVNISNQNPNSLITKNETVKLRKNLLDVGSAAETFTDLNQWAVYSNTAEVNPVSGTGGSPNITLTRNTTNPLSGLGDFHITKDAFDRQGQGISIPFTIDNRHLARKMEISFDYEAISGIIGEDDVRVSIVADPSGTPFVIEPVNTSIEFPTIGNRAKHIATFQTDFTIKNYRLCIHIASTTTEAFVVAFNNFRVWEQEQSYGAIITEWQDYIPSSAMPTNLVRQNSIFRRVGSNLEVYFRFTANTTTSLIDFTLNQILPQGLTIDENKLDESLGGFRTSIGSGFVNVTGFNGVFQVYFTNSGGTPGIGLRGYKGQNTVLSDLNEYSPGGGGYSFNISVPIQGWGSNMVLSSESGEGREVHCLIESISGSQTAQGFYQHMPFGTPSKDTHGGWNATTRRYTIPYSGLYRVSAQASAGAGSYVAFAFNNLSDTSSTPLFRTGGGNPSGVSTFSRYFNKGDTIGVFCFQSNSASVSYDTINNFNFFSIEKISSSSQRIARDETVALLYTTSGNTHSSSGNFQDLIFSNKITDTHDAYNNSNGLFTVPVSGLYSIHAKVLFALNGTGRRQLDVCFENNTIIANGTYFLASSGDQSYGDAEVLINNYPLFKGQKIKIVYFQNSGLNLNLDGSQEYNRLSITKVG